MSEEDDDAGKTWVVRARISIYDLEDVLNELADKGLNILKFLGDEVEVERGCGYRYVTVVAFDPVKMGAQMQRATAESQKTALAALQGLMGGLGKP